MILQRGALLPLLLLTGCGGAADDGALAEAGKAQIECALAGAKSFANSCTVDEMKGSDGDILVVGRGDVGYRRLLIATDGRGIVSADGAEPAEVTIVDKGVIEVAIGADRYRLPANTGGTK